MLSVPDYELGLDMSYDDYLGLDDYNFGEETVETSIYLYVYPVLLVFGGLGNILSATLLRHFIHRSISTCFYLIVVSILDLIVLLIRCGNDWLRATTTYDLSQHLMVYSDIICKVYPFVFNATLHCSKWLLVAMAIEGAIATACPARVATACTLARAKAAILLLAVLLICVNMHYFWSYELVEIKDFGMFVKTCTFTMYGHYASEMFVENVFPLINLLLSAILPEVFIFGCVVIMAVSIMKGRHRGDKKLREWQAKYLLDSESLDCLKVTFLVISLCYVILMLPTFTFTLFLQLVEKPGYVRYTYKYDRQKNLALVFCSVSENVFLSFKFFVYVATLPRFRTHLGQLFTWCGSHRHHTNAIP